MDEIALFNSELSSSDVTSIYNSGGPDDLASLSPVGWWRMGDNNSGSGTTITDQGSGGNDGTLTNGPTFSTDVPVAPSFNNSRSLSYDGTDDYALASSLSGHAAPFTMSFWFLTSNDANMVPFHYQDNLWFRMVLRSSSDGRRIRFYGSNDSNKTSTGAWVSGQWNHFAATVDSSGNTDLYLNGTYDSTHTGGGISAVTSNFMVGAQWHSGSPISDFNGQLDEVATWNAVLSNGSASVGATAGGDIAAIYNSGVPNDLASASSYDTDRTANLTNWWRMEEGSGTSVANSVTGGTALGLNNDTTFSTDVPVAPSSLTNTYSLSLDGTNDDCTVSNYAQTGSFSLSMWINPQAAISGPIYLFYKEASGVNGMNLDINSNTLRWTLYDDTQHPSPTTALVRYAPCTVAQNQWHHIVVTYDGSTSYTGMNHYIDGVKATSHSSEQNYGTNPTFQSAATSTIYVGTRGLYNNRFPLLVDEVAIFDKELSQSDVDSLRDGTSGQGNAIPADISSMADLDIWLRMEEGSGTSVVNTANSGTYDLTLINGPTFSTNVPT